MNLFEVFKISVNKKSGLDSLALIGETLIFTVILIHIMKIKFDVTNIVIGTLICLSIFSLIGVFAMNLAIWRFKELVFKKSNKSDKNEKYFEAYKVKKLVQNILNSDTYSISSYEIWRFKKLLKDGDITVEGLIIILEMLLEKN